MSKYKETSLVELKREINADFKKEIIAFANTAGGEIFIGVEKDGTVVGVTDSEGIMEQVGNMIRDGIKPDLTAYTTIETIVEDEKKIICIAVLRGTKRPYHLTDKGLKPSGVFVRHGVSSVPATDEAIRQMLRESDGAEFDRSRSANQELSFIYAENYFQEAGVGFTDNNKRSLGLVDADGYYTNSAHLLSDQCAHSIKCAVYEGTGKTKFKSRKEFFGSILKQMDEAYEYLEMNNNLNSIFEGLKRVDNPDYPEYALRESLLNSTIHRDYDYSGSTIINIFADRIEFVSIGGLVKGLTMEDILGGVSQPRNTIIATIFYRLELIEAYGTGIQRIIESYENSLKKPLFRPAPASFVVTLPKMDYGAADLINGKISQEELILKHFSEKELITRKDVELLLGKPKFATIKILNKLLDEGKIIKTGSAKAVKYRLN
ncbi:MAG: putative DNA binding domain-containing protein [Clostridiales bacterium]|nr:putative DNA binding domain-containing protein [Clostridiales bacterium]